MTMTAERAHELLAYDPETGELRWKVRTGGRALAGALIGNVCKISGYRNVRIDKEPYRLHRVIWLMQTGEWPFQIDHCNRDRADNRWVNLRETCEALNLQNVEKARVDSTTGLKGVHVDARRPGVFHARIKVGGKHFWLGRFETAELAHLSYLDAKAQLHPAWVPSDESVAAMTLSDNHLRTERRVRSDSRTGIVGVYPYRHFWRARFKHKHIGTFASIEQASAAVAAAAKRLKG